MPCLKRRFILTGRLKFSSAVLPDVMLAFGHFGVKIFSTPRTCGIYYSLRENFVAERVFEARSASQRRSKQVLIGTEKCYFDALAVPQAQSNRNKNAGTMSYQNHLKSMFEIGMKRRAADLLSPQEKMHDFLQKVDEAKLRGLPSVYKGDVPPAILSRMGYINYHKKNIEELAKESGDMKRVKQTMHPAVRNIKAPKRILSLRSTTLRKVAEKVNYIHHDKILFLRTTYDAHRLIGTNTLVEDDNGDCIMLSLYNYVAAHEDPSDIFPVGTYLAILAPMMKNAKDDPKQTLMLRCDNPECVRIFPFRRAWIAAKRGKEMLADVDDDAQVLRPRSIC